MSFAQRFSKLQQPVAGQALCPSVAQAGRRSRRQCRARDGQSSFQTASSQSSFQTASILQEQGQSNGHMPLALPSVPPAHQQEHAAQASAQAKPGLPTKWQQWLAFFEQADAAAESLQDLAVQLKDAVRQEQYQQAAAIKAQITALEEQDAVAVAQKLLQAALAEERYGDAAVISAAGLTGLQGWWSGQSANDPVGHLLHIKKDYGRWTGRVFRPRDIAAMKVNKSHGFGRPGVQSFVHHKPTGSPIFEVFVSRNPDPDAGGEFLHQPVSLQLPPFEEAEMQRSRMTPSSRSHHRAMEPIRGGGGAAGPTVRLSVSIRHDGTARIRHVDSQEPSAAAPSAPPPPPPSRSDEVVDIASQNAMSSLEECEDGSVTIVSEVEDDAHDVSALMRGVGFGLGTGRGGLARGASSSSSLDEESDALARIPARIEVQGRDRLVYHVPDYPSASQRVRAGASASASTSTSATWEQGVRLAGGAQWSLRDAPGSIEEGASHFEVIVPMARMPDARLDSGGGSSSSSNGAAEAAAQAGSDAVQAEMLNLLADQVAQSMEAKVGHSAPREQIAQAMREIVRRVASGEARSSVDVTLGTPSGQRAGSGAAAAVAVPTLHYASSTAAAASAEADVTSIVYKRIATDHPRTDPLSGLYLGSFGPHGPELLHLERTVIDGEEMVQAIKKTGDANIPAGLVSFRAKVGRKHRLDGRDVYPDELGIMARYKGEGRVAQKGFTQPRWVDGELLVFNSKGALTAGAELGFVWSIPGEKRFLILLNRVELK